MNALELRKQLLIAESQVNRALLVEDLAAVTASARSLGTRAKSFGLIASSAVALVGGLAALRRGAAGHAAAKPSWLQTILKGAGLISTLCAAFRSNGQDHESKRPNS